MQLCSPAEMRASFKLNFFVFHNVHQKKIHISSAFFFLFFMSIGHHCVFEAQIFCRKNSSLDVTFKHLYISFKKWEGKRAFSGKLRTIIYKFTKRISSCLYLLTLFLLSKSPLSWSGSKQFSHLWEGGLVII